MKCFGGVWLPAEEEHLVDWMQKVNRIVNGKQTYQYHKLEAAVAKVPQERRRVAVDVGAHVGLWSMHLADLFEVVHAFEPNHELAKCFALNVPQPNVTRYEMALGPKAGSVSLRRFEGNTGHTMNTLAESGGEIPMNTLDSLNLPVCDFVKIDVEGFEAGVIMGAKETLLRCRPVVIVECKGFEQHHGFDKDAALRLLKKLGMVDTANIGGDHILVWP